MKINPVSSGLNQSIYYQKKKSVNSNYADRSALQYYPPSYQNYNLSFGNGIKRANFRMIEEALESKYGMTVDFGGSDLVAECVYKTVNLFKSLFGEGHLPDNVGFTSLRKFFPPNENTEGVLGVHFSDEAEHKNYVFYNSDESCFNSRLELKLNEINSKIRAFHPTGHYLQTFVHEFGHSAHYKNLDMVKRASLMEDFREIKFDDVFKKFITIFKLGQYSSTNMNEFMAERITKDICSNLDRNDNFVGNKDDLDYSIIFTARWGNIVSTPQALLDLMTQQIWNGRSEEVYKAFDKMKACVLVLEEAKENLNVYNDIIVKYYKYLSNSEAIEKDIERLKNTEDYKNIPKKFIKKIILFDIYTKIQESIKKVMEISLGYPRYNGKIIDDMPFLNEFYKDLVAQEARKNNDKKIIIEQLMKYEYKENIFESQAVAENAKKEIEAICKSIEDKKIAEKDKVKIKGFFSRLIDRININLQSNREIYGPVKRKNYY